MRAAFVIFERMTALDLVGIYDPLTRLKSMDIMPDFGFDLCSQSGNVTDDRGMVFSADRTGESLADYDLLVVPGGFGTRPLESDEVFLGWLRSAEPVPLKATVCTGSVLLGAAGFLAGRRATTHPGSFDELAAYCGEVVAERIVDEGDVITSRGVSAGIDLGLYLVERLAGVAARERIAKQMDYPYRWQDLPAADTP
jgi:cyclohexyl-isocyanide hydratase